MHKVSISEVKPNPSNPRIIKDAKFKKLVQSLKDFPEMANVRPIVVNSDMVVLGGNMRLKAMIEAGWDKVPVEVVKWGEDKQREFIIKDNVGFGEWDWEMIALEWDADKVGEWGLDIPDFPAKELEAKEDDFEVPEGGIETDIVLGDLFEIGEHRLLCGDSTDSDAVARLLNGNKADLLFTDPPYNVGFNGRSGKFDVIENDDLEDKDFDDFIEEFAQTVHTLEIPIKYIWCNWKFYGTLQKHFELNACIVWAKNVFGLGRGYRHQHEFCFFEGKIDDGINNESDLWEIKKDTNYQHPTQKPIALTLVGLHQLKRKGFIMELDPRYCQVIVDRMLKLDPSIEVKRNGEPYVKK
jgi:hypothetical protein